jgi:hypothetical protein
MINGRDHLKKVTWKDILLMRSAALTSRSESLASRPKRSALEMDEEPCSKATNEI